MDHMMEDVGLLTAIVLICDFLLRLMIAVRVVMRRRQVGESLAWLFLVLFVPFGGPVLYLFFGELRLGNRRAKWAEVIHARYEEWLKLLDERFEVDWSAHSSDCKPLADLTQAAVQIPALPGNELELLSNCEEFFRLVIADIDAAEFACLVEFYIWHNGGRADQVAEALIRAAQRGVACRVLLDDIGSSSFLRSELAARMRQAGVHLVAALPASPLRALFRRIDLRLHRKIVVIDGRVGYTGSFNMVDPRFFKQDAKVGEWVDAMVKLRGPAVEGLIATFVEDWELETDETLAQSDLIREPYGEMVGDSLVQIVPSGPLIESSEMLGVLLMAIYMAKQEITITTPYFVPDEPLLLALEAAANRGVEVTLIVPAKNDSWLVRYASQAFKGDLLESGVKVMLFDGGLLHTKSVLVDGEFCHFGSLNLDPRSLYLNFEITLAIYDRDFVARLHELHLAYLGSSSLMDLEEWQNRSSFTRFTENALRLIGPLL